MYTMFSDTIAAISTPHGKGGVAVIRISGENAFEIAEKFNFLNKLVLLLLVLLLLYRSPPAILE